MAEEELELPPPHECRERRIADLQARFMAASRSDHVKVPVGLFQMVMLDLITHHRMMCTGEGVGQPEDRI